MTDIGHAAEPPAFGPPLRIGVPVIGLLVLALAYACVAIPLNLLPSRGFLNSNGGTVGNDFLAFYSAAILTWNQPASDVFDLTRLFALQDVISGTTIHFPFPYPPPFLFYVAPLAGLHYLPALYVWLAATSTPFIWLVKKLSGVSALVIVLAPPLIQNAISGQNGALTASLFAGGLLLITNKRPLSAGILFGLLFYKPQVFILIPICLLCAREYRAIGSLIATCSVLALGSIAAFGIDIWIKYLAFLPQQLAFVLDARLPVARCATFFMLAFHASGSLAIANAVQMASTIGAWVLVGWSWRKTSAVLPRALSFCVALPLSTPYMLEYDLAVWTLPAAILLGRLWRGDSSVADRLGFAFLWCLPPLIWAMSFTQQYVSVLPILPLVAYAIRIVRQAAAQEANRAKLALI